MKFNKKSLMIDEIVIILKMLKYNNFVLLVELLPCMLLSRHEFEINSLRQ